MRYTIQKSICAKVIFETQSIGRVLHMADLRRMTTVITAATEKEWLNIKEQINPLYTEERSRLKVFFHKSGVGILPTAFSLSKLVMELKPDLVIQAGIAGTFDTTLSLGKVVVVKNEFLGDVGVEENGTFSDVFDMKLSNKNELPFIEKALNNPWLDKFNFLKLLEVSSVTVNEITTRLQRIEQLTLKYNPAIESMEGACLHYVGLETEIPFIQIRAISNYVGEREKSKWQMKLALDNLTATLTEYIDKLCGNVDG